MSAGAVVLHVDLDCFYCQVEQLRLGIDAAVPLAVRQWDSLIAVNYAARAAGVSRHDSVTDAVAKCRDIRLVHVATYAIDAAIDASVLKPAYHEAPSKKSHKVSLDVYRDASTLIFRVIKEFCAEIGAVFEKASVDEAFVDVSAACLAYIEAVAADSLQWEQGTVLVSRLETAGCDSDAAAERLLMAGSAIAADLRRRILAQTKFTCSAGIAHNKMLAKICSALNKPAKQTVMPQAAVLPFLADFPVQKIRFFGGKAGNLLVEEASGGKVSDLWHLSVQRLALLVGSEAEAAWIYGRLRGEDDERVKARSDAKSLLSAKALRPRCLSLCRLEPVLKVLCAELSSRCLAQFDICEKWPKTLAFAFVCSGKGKKSIAWSLELSPSFMSPFKLYVEVKAKIKGMDIFPCEHVSLAATNFKTYTEKHSNRSLLDFENFIQHTENPVPLPFNAVSLNDSPIVATKVKPLDRFFIASPSPDECDAEFWKCPKCFQKVFNFSEYIQEHNDYHLALELQNSS